MKESKWSATLLCVTILLLLIGALNDHAFAAPGDLDLSFDPGSGVSGPVNAIVVQPDGKMTSSTLFEVPQLARERQPRWLICLHCSAQPQNIEVA